MGFGRSAVTKSATPVEEKRENIILDLKRGIRVFRLPAGSEEVKIKRHWMSQNEDGTWEPRFGYNPMDKRPSKPITVARWNPNTMAWEGSNSNWRNNPIDRMVALLSEEDRKMKYAQELFFLNVVDLTPVRVDDEGNFYYPDDTMKYPGAPATAKKSVVGKMRLLTGSSGDPTGKTVYANLMRLAKGALDDEGEPLSIYDYDIRAVTTGQGKDTNRSFNMGAVRPIPAEYDALRMYDLNSWPQVWPNEAIEALMQGADYVETVNRFKIKLYPDLIGETSDESEELF